MLKTSFAGNLFARYINKDGKRFENLDQILRHLVTLKGEEDEIEKVRLSVDCPVQTTGQMPKTFSPMQ